MATKRDVIVDLLRRRILSGEIPRGSRLRQDEVAGWFDASITPVREALHRLEAEGLVVSEPHRGVRVAGVDVDRVKTIYVKRMLLEPYAMRRAVLRMSRIEFNALYALLDRLAKAIDQDDREARNSLTRDFHFYFYERCGMPGLVSEIAADWDAFPWDLTLDDSSRADQSHNEHLAIVESARRIDVEAVAKLLENHIRHGVERLFEALTRDDFKDPFLLEND